MNIGNYSLSPVSKIWRIGAASSYLLSMSEGSLYQTPQLREDPQTSDNEINKQPVWPWIVSALIMCAVTIRASAMPGAFETTLVAWISSGVLVCIAAWHAGIRKYSFKTQGVQPFTLMEVLVLVLVLSAAFLVRIYGIEEHPFQLHNDEMNTIMAAQVFLGEEKPLLFTLGWWKQPQPGFFLASSGLRIFGDSLWGARMTSALYSTLTILFAYGAWRLIFSVAVAQIAAFLLMTSPLALHFGRTGFQQALCILAVSLALYLYTNALRRLSPLAFVSAGIASALAWQTYTIAYMLIPAFVVMSISQLLKREQRYVLVRGLCWFSLAFLLIAAPMISYYILYPSDFANRARLVVNVFSDRSASYRQELYGGDDVVTVLIGQTIRTFQYIFVGGDASNEFGYPWSPFSKVCQVLIVVGVVFCLARLQTKATLLIFTWILGTLILGGVMTVNTPYSPRLVGLLLFLMPLMAIPLEVIGATLNIIPARSKCLACVLMIAIVLSADALGNMDSYFKRYNNYAAKRFVSRRDWIVRVAAKDPEVLVVINCGTPENFAHESYRFMLRGRRFINQSFCSIQSVLNEIGGASGAIFMSLDDAQFEDLRDHLNVQATGENLSEITALQMRYIITNGQGT